jgi:hypothetical protein
MKDEKTSKRVATKASKVIKKAPDVLHDIEVIRSMLKFMEDFAKEAKSVAGSALTQTPDRKKAQKIFNEWASMGVKTPSKKQKTK